MPRYEIVPRNSAPAIRPRTVGEMLTAARTSAALTRQEVQTVLRAASVVGEGTVSSVKLAETASLIREAMSSHVALSRLRDAQAGSDPLLHADLGYYLDIFRLAAGEIAHDLTDAYCRESRGLR